MTDHELKERAFTKWGAMARTIGSEGKQTAKTIRENSTKLFAQHGYGAVSMRMIADAVGVQVSALYNHFPNKQALLVEVMTSHLSDLLEAYEKAGSRPLEPAKALEEFARFHVRYHIDKPDEVFVAFMELRSLAPESFVTVNALRQSYEQILIAILSLGDGSGDFVVEDTHITAMALLAMLTGPYTWYRDGGRLSPSEIESLYADLALRCVGCAQKEREHV